MRDDEFEIGYWLLDDELLDSDERRCGRVDDVELTGKPGEEAHIAAILCGPGAWLPRVRGAVRAALRRLFGEEIVRVPWDEVEDIDVVVHLKRPAADLGLGGGDDRLRPPIEKVPGA